MKDITKGDLLMILDNLPVIIKKDKCKIAQEMLPDIIE